MFCCFTFSALLSGLLRLAFLVGFSVFVFMLPCFIRFLLCMFFLFCFVQVVIDDAQFLDKDSWTLALAVATGEDYELINPFTTTVYRNTYYTVPASILKVKSSRSSINSGSST